MKIEWSEASTKRGLIWVATAITGADVEDWGCAMAWMPIMMIENSQMQRQTGAAVESFRNEMVKSNESSNQILLATAIQNKLIRN